MERKIWISLSVFLTVCLVLTAIVPTVFADGRSNDDTEEYVELIEEICMVFPCFALSDTFILEP